MTARPDPTTRRRFLRLAGGAGVGIAALGAGGGVAALGAGGPRLAAALDRAAVAPVVATGGGPILITIQLAGGLDFLDTVVPVGDDYERLRGRGAIDRSGTHRLDDSFALHPSLTHLAERWHAGELAVVHGVGTPGSSLSHFVDTEMWERGTTDESVRTGWLGRSLDRLSPGRPDPLLGLAVGELSPSMWGPRWNPVALPDDGRLPWSASFIDEHPGVVAAYHRLQTASGDPGASLADRVRASQGVVRGVADTLGGATDLDALAEAAELFGDDDGDEARGTGPLARGLELIADLILGGLETRAFHVRHGDFDTHADQASNLPARLIELDGAIDGLRRKLGARWSDVVVATWTEFGRRPDWNGNGTEHGTAGTQFVIGPSVAAGHHGEPSPLDRFDRDGNFLVTTDFRSYLAGLAAHTLGVGPDVVAPGVEPMEVVA